MVLLETQRKRPTRVQLPSNSTAALRSGRGATTSPVRLSVVWFPASVSYRARPVSFRLYTKDSSSQFAAAGGIKFPTIAPNSRRRRRGGPGSKSQPTISWSHFRPYVATFPLKVRFASRLTFVTEGRRGRDVSTVTRQLRIET